jgi:hypothetical protein
MNNEAEKVQMANIRGCWDTVVPLVANRLGHFEYNMLDLCDRSGEKENFLDRGKFKERGWMFGVGIVTRDERR